MSDAILQQVKELAVKLSPQEAEQLRSWLDAELSRRQPVISSQLSMYGLCADLGPGPTDEDIEEVRREMWQNFPRKDFE